MADSPPNSRVFSIRIVSLDYYMTPPIPNFDIAYTSLHGGKVKEVPVIRIYGSTPAGQKACLHIHRVLPYLYIPSSDLGLITDDQVDSQAHAISLALEKALKLKGNAGSKRQHVHGCSVVRARKFYGYHSSEELFVKIYFYYPQDVSRAAKLLLAGAVYDKVFQPYESHIPYLLQFLIDYNLYGMGHLHVSRMKFRYPVPDVFSPQRAKHNSKPKSMTDDSPCATTDFQADLGSSTIWISSTIPDGWIWQSSYQQASSENENIRYCRRQSTSELEGDAVVDEIINQQLLSFAPLSQTHSDVKMVQSLIPIWEEEFERTGVTGALPPDSRKPAPQDVLRILSDGIDFEKIMEVKNDGESFSTPQSIESSTNCGLVENGLVNFESSNNLPSKILNLSDRSGSLLSLDLSPKYVDEAVNDRIVGADRLQVSSTQASDDDAMQLLKWLASSQAAEDINSDDELARETILSPLLPAKNIDKMLEKANTDYESESQQECQDILDSIDFLTSEVLNGRASNSEERNLKASPSKVIPQFDGSSDDLQSTPGADKSIYMDTGEAKLCQEVSSWPQIDSSLRSKYRTKRPRMGSLPISSQKATIVSHAKSSSILDRYDNEVREGIGTCSYGCEAERFPSIAKADEMNDVSSKERASSLVECSTRDLMRRKRAHRMQHSEYRSSGEDWRAEICFEAVSDKGDASSEAVSTNDVQDKSSSLLPIHKPPVARKGINLCESDITSVVGACNEASIVKSLCSCFASVEDSAPSSSKNDIEVKSMSDNKDKESLLRLDPGARDSLQKTAVKSYPVPSNSAVGDHISEMACKIESGGHRSSYTCKVVDFSAEDLKSRENKAATLQFESSTSESVNEEAEPVKLIAMNFSKKPPTIEWTDEPEGEAPALSFYGDSGGGILFQDRSIGDCLPFFAKDFLEEKDCQAVSPSNCEFINNQEPPMGIPILYQNDGSHLFMLTPAVSPPSRESVDRWLSFDGSGTLKKKVDSSSAFLPISDEHSDEIVDSQGSQADISESALAKIASCSYDMLNLDQSNRYNQETCSKEVKTLHATDEKPSTGSSQDISQISGPDRKTKTTPLSQIGFRDPASVGAGQQLTLLSIEVQAESRGDLRPDPRFDAINVIVLVFQEDSESTIDAHVLMRCDSAVVRKDIDAVSECEVLVFTEELDLLNYFTEVIQSSDPDVLMGWDVQSGSLGFLAERAAHLGLGLLNNISRTPSKINVASRDHKVFENEVEKERLAESLGAETVDTIIEDEWGRTHASGVHAGGRIVLNVWRLMRNEVKLNMYTAEAVAEAVLRRKIPSIPWNILSKWFASGPGKARFRSIEYILERAKLNLQIMNQLDMINRTSELARVFGIDFFSVLSRGSQYRVESMFLRLAHTQNYLAISPGNHQVASQPAMECIPLVMEPESRFYADPVIVLDFQSLYPSMVIAYNLCFCTCLGKITPAKVDTLGVSSYSPERNIFCNLKHELLVTPNGVVYVPSNARKGILPRLLEEILSTRIMVKQAMKKLAPSQQVLHRILNARQLALKLIANVTYGYTAAGFSGRMPCAELADSIVQCGRRTLETAISFVNSNEKWKARVVYGDTDSMFVLLKGRSLKQAFAVGREIASAISDMNPDPVTLKMEKVYYPSFLLTKKRYVGYSYESPDQIKPMFDAKGIETVRRDTCEAVSKTLEQSLRMYFECQDINKVKAYLQRQWTRILSGRVSLKDFVFAKEVRLGTYSSRSSSLPPAAIVASKAMRVDPRAEPRYAERVPYVVVHGEPGARLVDMVVDPLYLLALDSPFRLNDIYYISKQIIPALQRVFGLVGADLNQWFLEMPRPGREAVGKRHSIVPNPLKTRIDYYYLSKHCILCGELVQASANLCRNCSRNESMVAMALTGRISKSEKDIHHLAAICRHCGGGDWRIESGVKCINLACSVFYERRKVQKELQSLSEVGARTGLYTKCMVEWF